MVIGLGSMIGAGVFAAVGPAASVAGSGLLIGLGLAAFVAYCNATSSASLAARYPASGGTYVYGRERLGAFWGYVAGWGFVVGKTASCAGMALTVGAYAAPSLARPIAVAAVVAITAVNYRGIRKTAAVTRVTVALVLGALVLVVAGTLFGGRADSANFGGFTGHGAYGILQSAGLLFFAFAGYARIATLGEEVVDPARTIPKAIPRALAITLAVYAVVACSALAAAGPAALARSDRPLATAVQAGHLDVLAPAVRVGGAVAALGVLLSLLAGVSRTVFAMAADGALPRWLGAVHPRHQVPHRADVVIGGLVAVLVTVTDLRHAIGFSSFCVLTYYAITNASAWTLPPEDRRWPRGLAAAGLVGCITLACTLPGMWLRPAAVSSKDAVMSQVRVHNFSISLDGFGTGDGITFDAPFGHAGERLHEWMFATRFWGSMVGEPGGTAGVDHSFAVRHGPGIGAEIMGRGKFSAQTGPWTDVGTDDEWRGWWGPNPPFHTPVFVLTHHPRPPIEMEGGTVFHFVDGTPEEVLDLARSAAGDLDVRIGGGPTVVRDYLAAGLIDVMHVVQVPILLGRGVRLWDGVEGVEQRYAIEAVSSPSGVTHLTFTRR